MTLSTAAPSSLIKPKPLNSLPTAMLAQPGAMGAPSVLLTGPSGSGKTDALGKLQQAGYRVAVIDLERRTENIHKYGPLIVTPTDVEQADRLIDAFLDTKTRQSYVQEQTQGKWEDIDVLGYDSLFEYETLLDRDLKIKYASKSGDSSFQRWDDYGNSILGLCTKLKRLAGLHQDYRPVGVVVTLGANETIGPLGDKRYDLMIRGRVAPPRLPFQFTYVFRVTSQLTQDGKQVEYVLETAGNGLKGPGTGVLPPRVLVNDDGFVKAWKLLEKNIRGDK